MCRYSLFVFLLIMRPFLLSAQSPDKAFAAYNAGDYVLAESSFRAMLLKNPGHPVAAFGLAKTYFMKDNRQYNIDSANYYAMKAAAGLNTTWKEADLKKFQAAGYRAFTVHELQADINMEAYRKADSTDELETWNHFITTFTTSTLIDEAIEKRNVLAFNQVMQNGDYTSYEEFLKNYPDAKQVKEARSLYEQQLYKSKTADSTWQSYKNFMEKYPASPYITAARTNYEKLLFLDVTKNHLLQDYLIFIHDYPRNPYVPTAEDSIYAISTRGHKLDQYFSFISLFPANRNINKAWAEVYRLENPVYSYQSFKKFGEKYPAFPDRRQLEKDLALTRKKYFVIEKDGLFGYADSADMQIRIEPQFTEAAPFSEGLAAVLLPCSKVPCYYSYVTLEGLFIHTEPWTEANDFHNGLALAAIGNCNADSCRYGFINRFGEWEIAPQYSDAFEFSDGLALVKKEPEGYGFIDKSGRIIIPLKYKDAAPFSEGVSCVQAGDSSALYGYIDQYDKWVISAKFTKAGSFAESLAPAANEKKTWGYIDHTGNWVIEPKFESALPFKNGTAKVVVKSKDPKNAKLFVMKEKTIDKKGKLY